MSSSRTNILSLSAPRAAEPSAQPTKDVLRLRGSLDVVSAVDVLQWLCNARQSWILRLHGQGVDGDVIVHEGELVSARWSGLLGLTALTEIVSCDWGYFDLVPSTGLFERNLSGSWQSLLLEAVHELDERRHECAKPSRLRGSVRPPLAQAAKSGEHSLAQLFPNQDRGRDGDASRVPSIAPEASAQDEANVTVDALMDRGFAALRTGNLNDARNLWLEALALAPDNRRIQFNLRKLDSLPPR